MSADELSTSERNRYRKIQRALLLAASDMDQAAAAARLLNGGIEDYNLARALETAIAVCYARVFTQSSLYRLDATKYEPTDARLAEAHRMLLTMRNKTYAHTDKAGGRDASVIPQGPIRIPGLVGLMRSESWTPIAPGSVPLLLDLFALQRQRFHDEAGKIEIVLRGPPDESGEITGGGSASTPTT